MLSLGEFDIDNLGVLSWIFFVVATLVVLIVMMNLLISIVSDTFEQVQMIQVIKDVEGKIHLLLEITPLFVTFAKRQASNKKFIAMATPFSEGEGESWEGRMRSFFNKI